MGRARLRLGRWARSIGGPPHSSSRRDDAAFGVIVAKALAAFDIPPVRLVSRSLLSTPSIIRWGESVLRRTTRCKGSGDGLLETISASGVRNFGPVTVGRRLQSTRTAVNLALLAGSFECEVVSGDR